jgi:hypothetical protein
VCQCDTTARWGRRSPDKVRVEERDIENHEAAEDKARGAEHERRFAKGGDVEEFLVGDGQDALAHDNVGDAKCDQGNESNDPSCSAKADPRLQRMK